jgi:hypothetical protein
MNWPPGCLSGVPFHLNAIPDPESPLAASTMHYRIILLLLASLLLASCQSSCEYSIPDPISAVDSVWVDGRLVYPGDRAVIVTGDPADGTTIRDSVVELLWYGHSGSSIRIGNPRPLPLMVDWPAARYTGFNGVESRLVLLNGQIARPDSGRVPVAWIPPTTAADQGRYQLLESESEASLENGAYRSQQPEYSDSTEARRAGDQFLGKVRWLSLPVESGGVRRVYRFRFHVVRVEIVTDYHGI